jgi:hypothetical protein
MDLMPHPDDPTTNAYHMWHGKPYDMLKQPILDFGCIVMAHIPLKDQGMLTGRAMETYYVGPHNNGRHGGVLLYNPKTKHTIVRRTFRVMGPIRQGSPQLIYEAAYQDESDNTTFNPDVPNNNVMKITELKDTVNLPAVDQPSETVPLLSDDSDSEDEVADPSVEDVVPQYGNDNCIENDPVPVGSKRKLKKHQPVPPPVKNMGQTVAANIAEYAHSKDHHFRRTKSPPTHTRSTPQASPPPKTHPQGPPDPGVEPLLIASGLALTATTRRIVPRP